MGHNLTQHSTAFNDEAELFPNSHSPIPSYRTPSLPLLPALALITNPFLPSIQKYNLTLPPTLLFIIKNVEFRAAYPSRDNQIKPLTSLPP